MRGELASGPAAAVSSAGGPAVAQVLRREQALMGTRFEIQVVSVDERVAAGAVEAALLEIGRVEALISEWQSTSEISEVNRQAGLKAVAVGPELYAVVEQAVALSALTRGAFDITFASCGHLWSVGKRRIPSMEEVGECRAHIDYRRIELNEARTIFLRAKQTRIGVGGIGKGYGVDRAASVLEAHGITDYVVDGGGDIRLKGQRIDRPWSVGVAHPRQQGALLGRLHLSAGAVVTSGDYERYFELDGERYHHIIDPTTGQVARASVAVTVIAPDAMLADGLATGLFVLGPAEALKLVERLAGVEALVIGPDMRVHTSSGFGQFFEPNRD
ncbi:MAG: FAD:protein FMN transferase [Bradymonadaceae bacterium]|nr:FAD:protein FMN transferase [Lujinxingiaceae bacterium]